MTVARTVADVLAEHVTFEVECIDRLYLNVYQPKLQYAVGLAHYVHEQLGLPIASTAPLAKISDRFIREVDRFARTEGIERVNFGKGQRKDDVMLDRLRHFTPAEGVVFIGRAQEKNTVFRTEKRNYPDGVSYPWIVRTTGVINQFYFYCVDADFGPFFLKFSSYFPYTGKLCVNGHHWAQRQAAKAGLGSPRWTTRSLRSTTRSRCRPFATGSARRRFSRCWTSGWRSCRTRSPRQIVTPVTCIGCRCCRPSFP
jgi:hypothetical protein